MYMNKSCNNNCNNSCNSNNCNNYNNSNSSNNKTMIKCPYCNSKRINKNGNKYNKQRYICNNCNKSFSFSDKRIKRSNKERELALLLYVSNSSIRSIQNVINKFFNTNIAYNVLDNWIKTYKKQLKIDIDKKIDNNKEDKEKDIKRDKEDKELNKYKKDNKNNNKKKTIDILEMDELWSYYYDLKKKEEKESKYGLLLIGTEIKLLHIK